MHSFLGTAICLFAIGGTLIGCSGESAKPAAVGANPNIESLKAGLSAVVTTGEGGSGLDSLRFAFEELKKSDPSKAGAIEGEFKALVRTGNPEERKALATKILQKL